MPNGIRYLARLDTTCRNRPTADTRFQLGLARARLDDITVSVFSDGG